MKTVASKKKKNQLATCFVTNSVFLLLIHYFDVIIGKSLSSYRNSTDYPHFSHSLNSSFFLTISNIAQHISKTEPHSL